MSEQHHGRECCHEKMPEHRHGKERRKEMRKAHYQAADINDRLIIRSQNETDRRTTDVSLTDTGRELAAEALAQRQRRHEEMFSCISEEEKQELLLLLEKIYADWGTRYCEDGDRGCRRHHEGNGPHGGHEHHKGHGHHGGHGPYEDHGPHESDGHHDEHGHHEGFRRHGGN